VNALFARVKEKNLLILEGQLIKAGARSKLTPEEWLERYDKIDEDDLIGLQVQILRDLARVIERAKDQLAGGYPAV